MIIPISGQGRKGKKRVVVESLSETGALSQNICGRLEKERQYVILSHESVVRNSGAQGQGKPWPEPPPQDPGGRRKETCATGPLSHDV